MPTDKVLIVEDRENWRDMLDSVLSAVGYNCIAVKDFSSAISALQQDKPSALILDLQLRDSTSTASEFQGWELALEALKAKIPVIVVTGHASVPLANEAFREYKVVAFLEKSPFDRDMLLSSVAEGIREFRLHQMSDEEADDAVARIKRIFRKGERIDK